MAFMTFGKGPQLELNHSAVMWHAQYTFGSRGTPKNETLMKKISREVVERRVDKNLIRK